MKKLICVALVLFVAFGFCSCVGSENTPSKDASSEFIESNSSAPAQQNKEDVSNEVKENESQSLVNENEALKKQIEKMETYIASLEKQAVTPVLQVFNLNYDSTLYLIKSDDSYALHLKKKDVFEEIHNDHYISIVKPSPDGYKIVFNDFSMEINAKVFLYDVESKQKKELIMQLPENRTASYMDWLDNRYFLFVVQLDHGSVVRGGDLYVYDTQTDQYKKILGTDAQNSQIRYFEIYGDDIVLIQCAILDDNVEHSADQYHVVTVQEIKNLIQNGKTKILQKNNALNK